MPCFANNTPGNAAARAALERVLDAALEGLPIRDYGIIADPTRDWWEVPLRFSDRRRPVTVRVSPEYQPRDATDEERLAAVAALVRSAAEVISRR